MDTQAVMKALSKLDISTWNYRSQSPDSRHMGPMAQDLYAAFGAGEGDRHITTVDTDGVTMASAKAVDELVRKLQTENQQMRKQIVALR